MFVTIVCTCVYCALYTYFGANDYGLKYAGDVLLRGECVLSPGGKTKTYIAPVGRKAIKRVRQMYVKIVQAYCSFAACGTCAPINQFKVMKKREVYFIYRSRCFNTLLKQNIDFAAFSYNPRVVNSINIHIHNVEHSIFLADG